MPNLKKLRELRKKTQSELAAVIPNMGVPDISRFENYVVIPTPTILEDIAAFLNVKVSDIYDKHELDFTRYFKTTKKRKECYKFTVRLPRKWKRGLLQMIRLAGYRTIEQWFLECIRQLEAAVSAKEIV